MQQNRLGLKLDMDQGKQRPAVCAHQVIVVVSKCKQHAWFFQSAYDCYTLSQDGQAATQQMLICTLDCMLVLLLTCFLCSQLTVFMARMNKQAWKLSTDVIVLVSFCCKRLCPIFIANECRQTTVRPH